MTFTEIIVTLIISFLFLSGLSQAAQPVLQGWHNANDAHQYANTLFFLNGSFRNACASPSKNLEKWKKDISIISSLDSCEISELKKNGSVVALRASITIDGEQLELIADCSP